MSSMFINSVKNHQLAKSVGQFLVVFQQGGVPLSAIGAHDSIN